MPFGMDYAMQTAWDFKGTSAEKHEEVMEARRKRLRDNPGLAEKEREEYSRWYREERVPPWQERFVDKLVGKKKWKGDGSKEEDRVEEDKTKVAERKGRGLHFENTENDKDIRRLSGSTLR